MPKMKTHKGMSKRIKTKKIKGKNKFFQRYAAQDHFNSRERGKDKRSKRKALSSHETNIKNIKRALRVK
jgi:ribosomal protein L35